MYDNEYAILIKDRFGDIVFRMFPEEEAVFLCRDGKELRLDTKTLRKLIKAMNVVSG